MDYINYDNQNQPSQQQQQPQHTTTTPLHPHHHDPAMNHSLPQHLQLQPVSQQHGSFLQPHHHSHPAVSTSTSTHLHHHHLQQGGQSVPLLHEAPIGFAPIPGGGAGGGTERSLLQQDVLPISHLPQVRDAGQVLDNLFSSVIDEGIDDPPADHLEPTVPSSLKTQPLETSTIQQSPSPSISTPMQPTESTPRPAPSSSITTPTESTRPPLAEKQPQTSNHENLQRNASKRVGKKIMAHANLPDGFSYQFADEKERIIKGVVVKHVIQKGQWFGPFNGSLLDKEAGQEIGSTWEICLRGGVMFYIDARNKIYNNWLYHINPARTREEQNLETFQHYGDIYFRALDTIQPGTELKVFYSDEYREKIGCKIKLDDLDYDKEAGCFKCPWCENTYQTSKSMLRHIKFTHSNRDQTPNMSRNLKERISKKARLMEALKEPSGEKIPCGPLETSGSKKPSCAKEEGHFVCVTCGNNFPTNGRLLAHELFHESTVEKFECDMCDAVYKTSLSLKRHKKMHEALQFRCTMCSKMYTTRAHLSRHMNTAHGFRRSQGNIVCKGCSRIFCLEDDMMQHLQSCKGLQMQIRRIQGQMTDQDEGFIPYEKFGCDPPSEAGRNASPSFPMHGESQTDLPKCTMCFKAYSSRSHLSRHMHTKHGFERSNGRIICMGCYTMFNLHENMSQHLEQCTGLQELTKKRKQIKSSYYVEDDDDSFIPKDRNEIPEIMQAPEQPWDESRINDLNKKKTLRDDTNEQGDDEKSRVIDMLGIRMDQDASRPFKCCYCKKRFFTKNRLQRHKWERHPNASVFKCNQCDRTFPNKYRLIKHLAAHNKEKYYKCQLCPRSFASESALTNHQNEHTDAKPHKCETCMKGFSRRRFLLEHKKRVHSVRELRFTCSFCDKKFPEKNYLVIHERRHTGIRPHVCLTCGKAFTSKHCLVNHNRVHTGEKPFKCHLCEKTFSLNHHLHDHLYTHEQSTDSTVIVQGSTPT